MKLKIKYQLLMAAASLTISQLACSEYQLNENLKEEFAIQKVDIAKKVQHRVELYQADNNQHDHQFTISKPGASFIKVHFEKFNLPEGAYIEVANLDGSEVYRYSKDKRSPFTYDVEAGEDGVSSFSAMSITGDTAMVRLVGKDANFKSNIHSAVVGSFMQGFSEQEIEELMSQPVQANSIGDVSIESTCGVNERRDVACWESTHPVEFERSRPVARLLINGSGLCTAWRVGADNHMFTNEHCVNSQSTLQNTEVWFNYQATSCGGSIGTTTKVTGNTLLQTDFTLDYTLFTVDNFAAIQGFGHFGLAVREASDQEVIYIPQHGAGNPKELSIESDQNTGGVCRVDDVNADGRGTGTDIGYFCDTIGGSSGSPVLVRSTNNVIALHHLGGCTNKGAKIAQIWPEVSNFFGGNIPVGDNGSGGNNPPTSVFSYNCNLTSCSFDGSASSDSDGSIASYDWNFGDGSTAAGANVNYDFGVNGSFNVTLTVTDDEGATASSSQEVTVNDGTNPNPPASPTNLTANVVKDGRGKKTTISYVDLNWSDNSNNETTFVIQRCQETGKGKNKTCNFADLNTLGADVTTYRDSSVTSGTYKYRVRAVNANGSSGYSNEVVI